MIRLETSSLRRAGQPDKNLSWPCFLKPGSGGRVWHAFAEVPPKASLYASSAPRWPDPEKSGHLQDINDFFVLGLLAVLPRGRRGVQRVGAEQARKC